MSCHTLITPLISGQEEYKSDGFNSKIDFIEKDNSLNENFKVTRDKQSKSNYCKLCYNPIILSEDHSICTSTSYSTSLCTNCHISKFIFVSKDFASNCGTSEFIQDLSTTTITSRKENCIPSSSSYVMIDDDDTKSSTSHTIKKSTRNSRRLQKKMISISPPPMPLSRVIKLAASFFFIYSAMNSISEYVTSFLPDKLGDESLFLLQTTLCASTLAAPSIVSVLGELRAMMLGGTTHVIYLAVLMQPSRSFVLGASALCGFGASASWVAQGIYLTRYSSPEKRGFFIGMFWGIYYIADIVGNLTAYALFKYLSPNAMFAMGACSASMGVLLLLFMEEKDNTLLHQQEVHMIERNNNNHLQQEIMSANNDSSNNNTLSCSTRTKEETLSFGTCERCGNPPKIEMLQICARSSWEGLLLFLLLTPMLFYAGCESAFWTGEYTKLLPKNKIGLVLLCTGLGQFLGSFLLGWLSDFFHCYTPTFLVGVLASAVGLLTCVPLQKASKQSNDTIQLWILGIPIIAFLGAFSFGVADGVLTTHTYAIIGRIFPGKKSEVWAIFNLLSNGGAASTYWFGMIFPMMQGGIIIQLWAQTFILIVGTPLYIIVDIWSASHTTLQMHMIRRIRARSHHNTTQQTQS